MTYYKKTATNPKLVENKHGVLLGHCPVPLQDNAYCPTTNTAQESVDMASKFPVFKSD